ncbi:MAG: F0F1 ATP synthase subunit A, partial [Chloroflexi bacterium]|nr:F0F1 ATP synthase subunit A [Chloroflexota bacterium]
MKGLFPQVVFTVFGIPIRDTVLSTWVMLILLTGIVYALGKRRPATLELLVEFVLDNVSSVMGRPADPYLPLLGTL